MRLMRYKKWYFIFSILMILPGLFFLITSGLRLGVDFTGGSLLEYKFAKDVSKEELSQFGVVTPSDDKTFIIRNSLHETADLESLRKNIQEKMGSFEVKREENIGPVIGKELSQKAVIATILTCIMIILFITFSFRKIPKPASSWRFGVSAVAALIHDVLLLVGLFAILGKFLHIEVDTLFVTALLTVMGFSVHDTIVVFDRIRENMPRHLGKKFSDIADISVVQTLARSLNTSLTVILVMSALLLFGGESIRWFVVALLVGFISGTYSSIFNATALLAWWEEKKGH